jgi:hypothetical protein
MSRSQRDWPMDRDARIVARVASSGRYGAVSHCGRGLKKGAFVRRIVALLIVPGLLCVLASAASADVVYHFQGITNNSATNTAIGEAQLFMTVSDATALVNDGNPYVDFLFQNLGPAACSITQIYWDDGNHPVLKSIKALFHSSGVSFKTSSVSPPNLPGGNPIGFSADIKVGPNAPVEPNGVNPGEWLKVRFRLLSGKTFSSVTDELNPLNYDLRVGIHVQGFRNCGSESFVAVPSPTSFAGGLGVLGLVAAGQWLRRRNGVTQTL